MILILCGCRLSLITATHLHVFSPPSSSPIDFLMPDRIIAGFFASSVFSSARCRSIVQKKFCAREIEAAVRVSWRKSTVGVLFAAAAEWEIGLVGGALAAYEA
jgi:hypothetical protein